MEQNTDFITVSTTIDSRTQADKLARLLVEQRMAACVQRIPIQSTYRWEGSIEEENEILLVVKSKWILVERIIEFIKSNHPYDVPEIIVTPIAAGHQDYLDWIEEQVG